MYFTGILSSGRCIVLFSSQFNSLQALTAGPHVDCKRACALFVLELQHSVASSDMGLAVCGRVCWHTPPYSDAPMLIALVWEEWRARRAASEDRARSQHDGKVHLTLHHHSDKICTLQRFTISHRVIHATGLNVYIILTATSYAWIWSKGCERTLQLFSWIPPGLCSLARSSSVCAPCVPGCDQCTLFVFAVRRLFKRCRAQFKLRCPATCPDKPKICQRKLARPMFKHSAQTSAYDNKVSDHQLDV